MRTTLTLPAKMSKMKTNEEVKGGETLNAAFLMHL